MDFINLIKDLNSKTETLEREKTVYCPSCGSKMIKRKNKWKDTYWYGCSDFPNCRSVIQEKALRDRHFKK